METKHKKLIKAFNQFMHLIFTKSINIANRALEIIDRIKIL